MRRIGMETAVNPESLAGKVPQAACFSLIPTIASAVSIPSMCESALWQPTTSIVISFARFTQPNKSPRLLTGNLTPERKLRLHSYPKLPARH